MTAEEAEYADPDPLTVLAQTYDVLGPLGEGGMGQLLQVRHRVLGEVRVAKILRAHLGRDERARARFLREAVVANRLRHPNLVKIHHSYLGSDGSAAIVMEKVQGMTLADTIRQRGALPVHSALEVGTQCLRGLAYLHRKGLVHRDVTTDNLMLGRAPSGALEVKLIDFGIVKVLSAETLTGTGDFLGTLSYASPEQTGATENPVGPQSDIYSLGVVLYESLVGQHPFPQETVAELLASQLMRPPPEFPSDKGIPVELRDAVFRAMAKKPEDRFPSAREFCAALEALVPSWSGGAGWDQTVVVPDAAAAAMVSDTSPDWAASLVDEARRRFHRGELWTAVELLQDALEQDTGNEDAMRLLRQARSEHRRVRRRFRLLSRVAELRRRAELLADLGEQESARQLRDEAHRLTARWSLSETGSET